MKNKRNVCPNGCRFPKVRKTICSDTNGKYYWGYPQYSFCPKCGAIMPQTLETIKLFLKMNHIHPKLSTAIRLLYKSEPQSAIREASIVLENVLQKKSGLTNLYGKDLAAQALKFRYDTKEKKIIEKPLIAVNKLDNISRINEQEGLMYMIMGYFQGTRNIYQHKPIGSSYDMMIIPILQVSYFLKLLDGHSITKNGHWIRAKISPIEVLNRTPKTIDRIRILMMYKRMYREAYPNSR